VFDPLASRFIKVGTLGWCRPTHLLLAAECAKIAPRTYDNSVEQSRRFQPPRRHALQSNTQRQHGHKGRYSYGNSQRGERIPQHSFAQVARCEFD
jgi:hypothetical protein